MTTVASTTAQNVIVYLHGGAKYCQCNPISPLGILPQQGPSIFHMFSTLPS